jgi:hypothetical protein
MILTIIQAMGRLLGINAFEPQLLTAGPDNYSAAVAVITESLHSKGCQQMKALYSMTPFGSLLGRGRGGRQPANPQKPRNRAAADAQDRIASASTRTAPAIIKVD